MISNAKLAWDRLKEKMHAKGIIAKLEALTSAIQGHITSSIPASTTITEIKDALTSVFEGSVPTQEEWLVMLLLNALADGEYDWLQKDLLGFMMNSKIQVSAEDIIECIETEHCKKIHTQASDTAMMAKLKIRYKPKHKCSVCGRSGHNNDKCWEAGGGCKGKAPDWWKKKQSLACMSKDKESS